MDAPLTGSGTERPVAPAPYRVLARKYRPTSFEDLIGQEAMVRTLRNAFALNRIHQAYVFTGVRGVGKTTTARIIARGLNYESLDGSSRGPTVDMPALGRHCEAIIESRHIDVIEMDAASNTSVNDVRDIIEAVRYRPAEARFKVYIIDEVHMLSGSAFNALLKTLEEPPPHVKFLFATTEIRKLPVTVLSRCQRFDLRRVEAPALAAHLRRICTAENVAISDEALAVIIRAGEGSVRDSLSLLDQAIAHGGGTVDGAMVRSMLGLADRSRVLDLFDLVMRGEMAAALEALEALHDAGVEPASLIADLAETVHLVTRLKIAPEAKADPVLTPAQRERGQAFAAAMPMRALTRAWQILTHGLAEVQGAARPLAAAEMLLVRLAYAADLPTPDEALRRLRALEAEGAGGGASRQNGEAPPEPPRARLALAANGGGDGRATSPVATPQRAPRPGLDLEALVALAKARGEGEVCRILEEDLRPVRVEEGLIETELVPAAPPEVVRTLAQALQTMTGRRWTVALVTAGGRPSLRERREAEALRHPIVQALLATFPGARVLGVRDRSEAKDDRDESEASTPPAPDDEPEVPPVAALGMDDGIAYDDFTDDDL